MCRKRIAGAKGAHRLFMAGDYLQIDNDLPEKPETQRICDLTGEPLEVVIGRILLFWRWVDRHASGALVAGASVKTLVRVATGTETFWESVASLGDWLEIRPDGLYVPGWKKRFSQSAKKRIENAKRQRRHRDKNGHAAVTQVSHKNVTGALPTGEVRRSEVRRSESDPLSFTSKVSQNRTSIGEKPSSGLSGSDLLRVEEEEVARAAPLAGLLFKRSGYSGTDGALLWKIAVLVTRGLLQESWAHDAAEGARINAKRNPVGFVRKTLAEASAKHGVDLDALVGLLQMPRGYRTGPPSIQPSEVVRELAGGFGITKQSSAR